MDINSNIKLIIEKFGRDHGKSTDNYTYNCPFCMKRRGKDDSDRKLYVSTKNLVFHCFKCGAKGRLKSKEIESSFGVYNNLMNLFNESSDLDTGGEDDNMFIIPNIGIPESSVAYKYCIDRGITDEHIKFYSIRLGIGKLFGRIVIPNIIYGNTGVWTDMYSARTYLSQTPKYLNPENCKKTNSVFNLHNIEEGSDVYIVEGAITAIHAGRSAVAVYGCHPSDAQINAILAKRPRTIYCVLDNDEAGRPANENLAKVLSNRVSNGNVYLVYMPNGKDAADLGETRFKDYVDKNKIQYYSSVYNSVASYFEN